VDRANLVNLAYLAAAVLFIFGLKGLAHPRTAVRANLLGAVGMLIAVVATLYDRNVLSFGMILLGLVLGSAIGVMLAVRIRMTAMPQMVALLNGLGVVVLLLAWWEVRVPEHGVWGYWLLVLISSVLGLLLVNPIGGADMPVVIALLNSYSGLAAAATGFVLDNQVLIISGSLVGASGIILSEIMCRAMNRSLMHVLFGTMEAGAAAANADEVYGGRVKSAGPEEIAMLFDTARRVVIVPGYGMAVAQCQHAVRDLTNVLESRGIEVEFGIHPVAGRMPGHMNVLLAEAEIPYDKMKALEEINPSFPQTDVVLVIGANDVVNPLARTDPTSPIAGMPILDVDKARTVVVVKRSLSPGFAGIPNPLFAADNALMYFADGKKAILDLIGAVKG
jgi:NAD(P) transhydrogenase subunit beta